MYRQVCVELLFLLVQVNNMKIIFILRDYKQLFSMALTTKRHITQYLSCNISVHLCMESLFRYEFGNIITIIITHRKNKKTPFYFNSNEFGITNTSWMQSRAMLTFDTRGRYFAHPLSLPSSYPSIRNRLYVGM